MSSFKELLSRHIGTSFARQLAFADFIDQRNWQIDLDQGIATFGNDLQFPIQLIGTEAEGDETWLWGWANTDSNLPENLLTVANQLKSLGEKFQIAELIEPTYSLDRASGHTLSMIATGVDGQTCYYRGPYPGGAIYFLVSGLPQHVFGQFDGLRVLNTIPQILSQGFDLDLRLMAESFLTEQNFELQKTPEGITAVRGEETITLAFDDQGRITNIGGQGLQSPAPPVVQKKPWWKFW